MLYSCTHMATVGVKGLTARLSKSILVSQHRFGRIIFDALIADLIVQQGLGASCLFSTVAIRFFCFKVILLHFLSCFGREWRSVYFSANLELNFATFHSTVGIKKSPLRFSENFPKRLGIFNLFFTHLSHYHFYTRLQIFIQISSTLTKLCHTKGDHLANFYISLEL